MPSNPEADLAEAGRDLAEAELECDLANIQLLRVDTKMERVRLHLANSDGDSARRELQRADEVARAIGYKRCFPELDDLAGTLDIDFARGAASNQSS